MPASIPIKLTQRRFRWVTHLGGWLALLGPWGLPALPSLAQETSKIERLIIQLDDSGVVNWDLANPRKPYPLVEIDRNGSVVKDKNENSVPKEINISFENRGSNRIFLVRVPVEFKLTGNGKKSFFEEKIKINGTDLIFCELLSPVFYSPVLPKGRLDCGNIEKQLKPLKKSIAGTLELTIYPGQNRRLLVGAAVWKKIHENLTDSFKEHVLVIQVDFFNELEKPARDKAFFQIGPGTELKSASSWKITASVAAARSPLALPELAEEGGDGSPGMGFKEDLGEIFRGDMSRSAPASGSLFLNANVGSRAAAQVTFKLYQGDLGDGEDPDVTVSDYRFDYFGKNNMILRYGKYTLAAPSSAVAVKEKGEGLEYRWRALSLGYLLKRESETGVADDADRDDSVTLLQLKNWSFSHKDESKGFHSLSATALYGREEKNLPEKEIYPYDYWTLGAEAFFFMPGWDENTGSSDFEKPHHSLKGSLAYYRSERNIREDGRRDGKGEVALLKLNWNHLRLRNASSGIKKTRGHQVNLTIGYGSGGGDERVDKGYLGETAAFRPDKLFLARLAGVLVDRDDPEAAQPLETAVIGKGLSNKHYAGLSYTNGHWTPITWLVKKFKLEDRLTSQSFQLGVHHYRLGTRGGLPDDDLGWEFDMGFNARAKPATFSFSSAYFDPGPALAGLIEGGPWSFKAEFSLTLDDL